MVMDEEECKTGLYSLPSGFQELVVLGYVLGSKTMIQSHLLSWQMASLASEP